MLPKNENLILADKLVIYNNFAKNEGCEGRLLVELQIYPTPRLVWDFEIRHDQEHDFPTIYENLSQNPFIGNSLRVEALKVLKGNMGGSASGSASKVVFGNPEDQAHTFYFYLTNTKFLYKCMLQDTYEEIINEKRFPREENNNAQISSKLVGKFIDIPLNSIWSLKLQIMEDSLKWLNENQSNIGTRLTSIGNLYQAKRADEADDFPASLSTLSLTEAQTMLNSLCRLLSYANGGRTAPIYIEGEKYNSQGSDQTVSALVRTDYQVTPLEQLGDSWLVEYSNLRNFISCFSSFERMLTKQFWEGTFNFVLFQYFQAIRGGDWELVASATGAALERLSYAILVEDETDPVKKAKCELLYDIDQSNQARTTWNLGKKTGCENISITGKRLRLLLEHIGLTSSRGYNDMQDVQTFLKVRNDAVHPIVNSITMEQRWRSIMQGIQWIDEILLWRLGYDGRYLDRITYAAMIFPIAGSTPITVYTLEINPRYDLSLRNPSW